MFRRLCFVIIALAGASGCAVLPTLALKSDIDQFNARPPAQPVEFMTMPSVAVTGPRTSFTIDQNSPFGSFKDIGNSYYQAFTLPPGTDVCPVRVQSFLFTSSDSRLFGGFFPSITVLDETRQPWDTTSYGQVQLVHSTLFDEPGRPSRLEVVAQVQPSTHPRLIVVHVASISVNIISVRTLIPERMGIAIIPNAGAFAYGIPAESIMVRGSPVSAPGGLELDVPKRCLNGPA